MADGFELDLTLFVPAQELDAETTFFAVSSENGRAMVALSLLPNMTVRWSGVLDGAVYVETTTTHPLPVNKLLVLAAVVAGGDTAIKARLHIDDVVAAKVRQEKPAPALLEPLGAHVIHLNRAPGAASGIRFGVVEFVVASKELPALERSSALQYYRANARRVGHLTWFEADAHGFQHPGAQSLKLSPGVATVPIPAASWRGAG